jgi:nucleotide-binding universal stress UspA family protein
MAIRYFERVIVGLALAPVDHDLLQYARMLDQLGRGKSRFTFIHALPAAKRSAAPSLAAVSEARSALSASVAESFGSADAHEVRVVNEDLVDALLGEAGDAGADLVLVGHRRNSRGRRSLSRRLAIKAPCSVWMVPEGSPARITNVVTAVDMSQPSALALSFGTLVANRAGLAQCTILHVLTPSLIGYEKEERAVVTSAMAEFLAPVDVHGVDVTIKLE